MKRRYAETESSVMKCRKEGDVVVSIFNIFNHMDTNTGVEKYLNTENAVLLDVRTKEEYEAGHIENSVNIPLQSIETASEKITDKNIPLFVYCQSGARSKKATDALKAIGYVNITNIGGISKYHGKLIKGSL